MSKRAIAVEGGAIQITMRQAAAMNYRRRLTGLLGTPTNSEEWLRDRIREI